MLSYETKKQLSSLLLSLSEGERQLEIVRQILCEQPDFEPYAAFCRIDRLHQGYLTAVDIKNFLADNAIYHSEKACAAYVRRYSGQEGEFVSYTEFLKSVLPMDNPTMRTLTTQRPNYEVRDDEYLVYDVEYALSKVIDREIALYMGVDHKKFALANRFDYSHTDAFRLIDKLDTGRIDYDNLKGFFRGLSVFPYDEELIAVLRRLDKDDDGILKLEEFVEGLDPIDQELKLEQSLKKSTRSPPRREASPSRGGDRGVRVQSPQRTAHKEDFPPVRRNISPVRNNASPKRMGAYSPARRDSPLRRESPIGGRGSPARRSSPRRSSPRNRVGRSDEEAYTDKLLQSISKERNARTPSTADKTTPLKKTNTPQIDKGISASKRVRKVLEYGKDETSLFAETLAHTLKQFIVLDKDIEVAKQDLALRPDFNLLDFFRVFDMDAKGAVGYLDIEDGFKKFGIFPNRDELYLWLRRYDRDSDGKLRFSDFIEAFTPKQNEYSNLLNNRTPLNGDLSMDITEVSG